MARSKSKKPQSFELHIMPDGEEHIAAMVCSCSPDRVKRTVVQHQAEDGRLVRDRRGRLAAGWSIKSVVVHE